MTLAEMLTFLYDRFDYPTASPPTAVTTRFKSYLNEGHRKLLAKGAIGPKCRRALVTFSTVANSPFAVLPQAAVALFALSDRTNQYSLSQFSLADIRFNDPGLTSSTSAPWGFTDIEYAAAVSADPSDASALFVVSNDAADTARTAYVEGINSAGQYVTLSVTLNGTVGAQLALVGGGTESNVIAVTKFYLSTTRNATVTLREDGASGTILSTLTPYKTYARYTRLHLYPTVSSAITLYADVELHVENMANDTDQPLIPEDFHWLLPSWSSVLEYEKRKDVQMRDREQAKFKEGYNDLTAFLNRHQGPVPSLRRPRRFSQLGSYYPSGS